MAKELEIKPKFYYKDKDSKYYNENDCIGFENTDLASSKVWKDNRLCGVPGQVDVNRNSKWLIIRLIKIFL